MYGIYRLLSGLAEKTLARRYPERFSAVAVEAPAEVWMHAASVGESRVAAAIVRRLLELRPRTRVFLTLQTETGLSEARKLLAHLQGVRVELAPWDGPCVVRDFLERLRPRVLALVETELWPNLMREAAGRGVSLLILNGRLSPRSFTRYRWLIPLFRPVVRGVALAGVISEEDGERFRSLGVPAERIVVGGNAKHDLTFERIGELDPAPLVRRLGLGPGERVVIFGSMRGGEEDLVRETVAALLGEEGVRFVVVPRHPQRAPDFYQGLSGLGATVAFFRRGDPSRARIVVVDEVGSLFGLYALAEAAVVGGGFVPKGGQNPVEPAMLGKPVIFGPHMENFLPEVRTLLAGKGAVQVGTAGELSSVLRRWLRDPAGAREVGRRAFSAARRLRGASRRYAEMLLRFLNGPPPA